MDEIRKYKEILQNMNIVQYNSISLYGVGDGGHLMLDCFKQMGILEKIKYVVDRDDSEKIGSNFENLIIDKLSDIITNTDLIIISAKVYRAVIKERVKKYLSDNKLDVKVLDIFAPVPLYKRKSTLEEYKEYVEYIENQKFNINPDFVPITKMPYVRKKEDTKVIAWYLPQYYQMEVNNKFHGQGFTEWTNVTQAIPLFTGHYQPHIPYDVGFYDLSNVNAMKRQVELAKMYGVYGFCFHYYWFSGERTMEKPLEMLLEHKEIDMPFCLNWATENWTSVWDGGNYDLIFEQKLNKDDDTKFMDDIISYMKDDRYIKIDGKPVLSIYTGRMFGQERFKTLLSNFRKYIKKEGFPDLYIMHTNFCNFDEDVKEWGCDALVEFPPTFLGENSELYIPDCYINPYFQGEIYDITKFIQEKKYLRKYKSNKVFRSAMVSFDNTARKTKWGGVAFIGTSPETFKSWMLGILNENKQTHNESDNYVFVNSWNEWAEASHLEPDMKYGYSYLQAVKESLEETREINETIILEKHAALLRSGITNVHFYIHCIESMGDIVACEPIARYLKVLNTKSKITWIVRDNYKEIVAYNPNIDEVIEVDCLSQSIDLCNKFRKKEGNIIIDCHYNGRRCRKTDRVHINTNNQKINENTYFNYGSLLESFCLSAGLPRLFDAPQFYQKDNIVIPRKLPEKYIVFHCKSAEDCKDWGMKNWNEFAALLLNDDYQIVEIGLESVIQNNSKNYYDCTDIHDIQVISEIIKQSDCFVGIDSSFAHIANCFHVPGILIFGKYKTFEFPMPYTGYYAHSIFSKIIYAQNELARTVKVTDVYKEFKNIIRKI